MWASRTVSVEAEPSYPCPSPWPVSPKGRDLTNEEVCDFEAYTLYRGVTLAHTSPEPPPSLPPLCRRGPASGAIGRLVRGRPAGGDRRPVGRRSPQEREKI